MPKPSDVITFRLSRENSKKLINSTQSLRIVGVKSRHQLAHKVVSDYVNGHLVYLSDQQRFTRPW
jgi:hypothetical protein